MAEEGWGSVEPGFHTHRLMALYCGTQYPERLGVAFLVDAPALFQACWAVVKPFLPAETKKKIFFVSRSGTAGRGGKMAEKFAEYVAFALHDHCFDLGYCRVLYRPSGSARSCPWRPPGLIHTHITTNLPISLLNFRHLSHSDPPPPDISTTTSSRRTTAVPCPVLGAGTNL
jgi:hypothetical protein